MIQYHREQLVIHYNIDSMNCCVLLFTMCVAYLSAQRGETLTLPCYTAVSTIIAWKYRRHLGNEKYIYKGAISDEYAQRFKLLGSYSSLQIINIQYEDSGFYTCVEGNTTLPTRHTFQVIVNCNY